MKRGLLEEHFTGPCFHSQGQFQANWNESVQNILGKAQSPADWYRTFSLVHVQMGSCSITELRMWRHRADCRSRHIFMFHTSCTERNMRSADFGCCNSMLA